MSRNYLIAGAVGVAVLTGATYWLYKRCIKNAIPKRWRRIGTLEHINIFPIKSCAPLELRRETEVSCELLGLRFGDLLDRSFMLIDPENKMITARIYPHMVLIKTKLVGGTKLIVSSPNMEEAIEVDLTTLDGKNVSTDVWGSGLEVMLCGSQFDIWFSQCILNTSQGLRLVYYMHSVPVRETNQRMRNEPYIRQEDSGTFNDATSYMLLTNASVDDLNSRLERKITAFNFRGNFHIKLDIPQPYAEDDWNWVRIGDVAIFRNVAPCTRCIFPNIDPLTGERDRGGEPLRTLRNYRSFDGYASPVFGIHLGMRQPGIIRTNDVVYVGIV